MISDGSHSLYHLGNSGGKTIAFVDADNLKYGLERALREQGFANSEMEIFKLEKLFAQAGFIDRFILYSAVAQNDSPPKWITELRAQPRFVFREARLTKNSGRTKQEGVDVKLAVEAMQYTFRRTLSHCVIVSGDGDLLPLIEAVVAEGITTSVVSFANPDKSEVAGRLRDAADEYFHIGRRILISAYQHFQNGMSNKVKEDYFESLNTLGKRRLGNEDYECFNDENGAFIVKAGKAESNLIFWRGFPDETSASYWIRLNGGLA